MVSTIPEAFSSKGVPLSLYQHHRLKIYIYIYIKVNFTARASVPQIVSSFNVQKFRIQKDDHQPDLHLLLEEKHSSCCTWNAMLLCVSHHYQQECLGLVPQLDFFSLRMLCVTLSEAGAQWSFPCTLLC